MDKQRYHKPVFRTYGNITILTQSISGSGKSDGGGVQTGMRNRTG